MTTNVNKNNVDFEKTGKNRPINFFNPPFSLQQPLCIAEDTKTNRDLYIMMYNLESLSI